MDDPLLTLLEAAARIGVRLTLLDGLLAEGQLLPSARSASGEELFRLSEVREGVKRHRAVMRGRKAQTK